MMFLLNLAKPLVPRPSFKRMAESPKRVKKLQTTESELGRRISSKAQRAISVLTRKKLSISVAEQQRPISQCSNVRRMGNRRYSVAKRIAKVEEEKFVPHYNAHHYRSHTTTASPNRSLERIKLDHNNKPPFHEYYQNSKTKLTWAPPTPQMYPHYTPVSKSLMNVSIPSFDNILNRKHSNQVSKHTVRNYARGSRAGRMMSKVPKQNQDEVIIAPSLGEKDSYLFAVADGHGINGKQVSLVVKYALIKHLKNRLGQSKETKEALEEAFRDVVKEVRKSRVDISLSGSTCCCALVKDNKIVTANVGDSRCIVGVSKSEKLSAKQLTRDHKPNFPGETERILEKGGVISRYEGSFKQLKGPYRIFAKGQKLPGLAISRSIGDTFAWEYGVISQPDINVYDIEEHYKFIVVATDGVWELMKNEEVAKLVFRYYERNDAEAAVQAVIQEAYARWIKADLSIDDISCVVIFLN